jgi:hypothetical protein
LACLLIGDILTLGSECKVCDATSASISRRAPGQPFLSSWSSLQESASVKVVPRYVKTKLWWSGWLKAKSAVRQGSVLSPFLFNAMMDETKEPGAKTLILAKCVGWCSPQWTGLKSSESYYKRIWTENEHR